MDILWAFQDFFYSLNVADDLLKTALKQAQNVISAKSVINGNDAKS